MEKFYDIKQNGKDHVIVHSVLCNERRTNDGVKNGGERVVEEVMEVIQSRINEYCPMCMNITDVTLSFVGNSLGGLYSRYAIARIYENLTSHEVPKETDYVMRLENGIPLHFNIFCTTASPHLGTANHTYLPLPRTAEIGIGYVMGATGQDL